VTILMGRRSSAYKTVNLRLKARKVLVTCGSSPQFRLLRPVQVRIDDTGGCLIDAPGGAVTIKAAANAAGAVQSGDFEGGAFRLTQVNQSGAAHDPPAGQATGCSTAWPKPDGVRALGAGRWWTAGTWG
jgi:hypothetical protein